MISIVAWPSILITSPFSIAVYDRLLILTLLELRPPEFICEPVCEGLEKEIGISIAGLSC